MAAFGEVTVVNPCHPLIQRHRDYRACDDCVVERSLVLLVNGYRVEHTGVFEGSDYTSAIS